MKALVRLMTVPAHKRDKPWLHESLQAAVELEMSTIPPYLYAAWSVDAAQDPSGGQAVLLGIAVEEMLHMAIACNLLAAIGGKPRIVGVAPKYPLQFPKDVHKGLTVTLAPLSKTLLLETFMAIEEPTDLVVDDPAFKPSQTTLIGQFYSTIQQEFETQTPSLSASGQVDLSGSFPRSFVVATLDDVRAAIGLIKRQGEGTSASPFEDPANPGELAHFYQFGEIFHGKSLTKVKPFSYTGSDITMATVRAVLPAGDDLAESKAFNILYSNMLRDLQRAWDGGGASAIDDAVPKMFGLGGAAENVILKGFGPAFTLVDTNGIPVVVPTVGSRFAQVREILDAAVGGGSFGAHGPFWRGLTRDQFVQHRVFGQPLLMVGHGRDSNLVKALRGELPFGSDAGTAGATFRRMPAGRPAVAVADIDIIEHWINDGCPDAPARLDAPVSLTTGAFRPNPSVHVAFWRDLDDWAMFHSTPDVQEAIGTVFGFFPVWTAFARGSSNEAAFVAALAGNAVRSSVTMLSARQQHTLETHYGVPLPLLTVLDGFERFGNNGLPDDPNRPNDVRHNMNGAMMWFVWSAFAEAAVRLDISADFWRFYMRAILCGLLNDGLFRGRFTVQGFAATDAGRHQVLQHAQNVPDADLPSELRRRFVESAL